MLLRMWSKQAAQNIIQVTQQQKTKQKSAAVQTCCSLLGKTRLAVVHPALNETGFHCNWEEGKKEISTQRELLSQGSCWVGPRLISCTNAVTGGKGSAHSCRRTAWNTGKNSRNPGHIYYGNEKRPSASVPRVTLRMEPCNLRWGHLADWGDLFGAMIVAAIKVFCIIFLLAPPYVWGSL